MPALQSRCAGLCATSFRTCRINNLPGRTPAARSASSDVKSSGLVDGSGRSVASSSTSASSTTSAASPQLPNELLRIIETHIKTHGPIPLPRYIQLCLSHPTLGYYTRLQRASEGADTIIGKQGDFVTSPEISQVFGELLAVWYVSQWQAQGMPAKTRIVELGPGRGTLMDDMLRTFRSIRGFGQTLQSVHLVETSAYMRKLQKEKLASHASSFHAARGLEMYWHHRIEDIPSGSDQEGLFTMLVAHEFFDALPIHLFEKRATGFREIFVDIDTSLSSTAASAAAAATASASVSSAAGLVPSRFAPAPRLRYAASPAPTLASNLFTPADDPKMKALSDGARVEVCPEAYEIAAHAGQVIGKAGAGLVVDYGGDQIFGSSFRAFKSHRIVDPLEEPGSADLTSNVNFSFLREALTSPRLARASFSSTHTSPAPTASAPSSTPIASGSAAIAESAATQADVLSRDSSSRIYVPPVQSQRSFLLSLGLELRVQNLVNKASDGKRREEIIRSAERLVEKNEKIHGMGKVFKVMAFVPQKKREGSVESGEKAEQEVFPFGLELD